MKPRSIVAALTLGLATTLSLAGGDHAGGHDEDGVIGAPGVAAKATRTVDVDMTDAMRFRPARISVRQGETVRFRVTNSGQLRHEFVLGTQQDLKAHGEAMKKNPEMEHADDNMVTLAPGKAGEVVWRFTQAGKVDFACLQPGHYDAGMTGAVTVTAGKSVPSGPKRRASLTPNNPSHKADT